MGSVLAALQTAADAAGKIGWTVSVDSTVSRAHQHAAGARRDGHLQKEPPGGVATEPDDHGLGRSRGGFTTKTHLACEQGRKTLAVVITAGQRGDSPQFIAVLQRIKVHRFGGGRPRTRPSLILADNAYTRRGNRGYARRRKIRVCIPSKVDHDAHRKAKGSKGGRPHAFDPAVHRLRHAVECGISQLKHRRAMATRYDNLAVRFEATVTIAVINQWLRPLRNHDLATCQGLCQILELARIFTKRLTCQRSARLSSMSRQTMHRICNTSPTGYGVSRGHLVMRTVGPLRRSCRRRPRNSGGDQAHWPLAVGEAQTGAGAARAHRGADPAGRRWRSCRCRRLKQSDVSVGRYRDRCRRAAHH
jgi:hypothetical protein